jgi:hypothetical protein
MALSSSEEKLLRLALDPAAHPGEADNAAVALIRSMRKRGVSAYAPTGLEKEKGHSFTPPPPPPKPPGNYPMDWPGSIEMPWGKHKGKRLCDIDPGYFRWCLQNLDAERSGDLLEAMRWLLEDLASRRRNRGFR